MITRTLSAVVVAAAALASSASLSFAQQVGDAGFAAQLNEANATVQNNAPAGLGREERLIVQRYLSVADSLHRQGQTTQAQAYLNFARGELGLRSAPDSAVASSSQMVAR
ncbi:hypothetical protein [Azospirillum canadense]|uniref:hypothetical protein n=1 Tax=Azospirillum canadense TaxID=403962 RepID=UPI0022266131|nr:hypothetical protein [Azospirillum canadense]MCW2240006.1 hypothetical protein [Azospirillum canadense]